MNYEKIIYAKFIDRPNRFIANVEINGHIEKVHVKNTGRCKELLIPGAKLILEDKSHIKERKTKYSIIAVWKDNILINMDSQAPNQVIYDALINNKIKELQDLKSVKREVTYENSRFDIAFQTSDRLGFMEVKGVTLEHDNLCRFPDAPTTRGTKHVLEMIKAVEEGFLGYIMFLVQMKGPKKFYLNWETDPIFSEAIVKAKNKGVNILVYDAVVTENSFTIGENIKIDYTNYRK